MKIEVNDKLWFGFSDDGMTNSVVVEHILLDDALAVKIRDVLKDESIDGLKKVDAIILLRPDKVRR
jgi:hypothetical protein